MVHQSTHSLWYTARRASESVDKPAMTPQVGFKLLSSYTYDVLRNITRSGKLSYHNRFAAYLRTVPLYLLLGGAVASELSGGEVEFSSN
jgi:hypothetical protein